jgi:hypothetical protein
MGSTCIKKLLIKLAQWGVALVAVAAVTAQARAESCTQLLQLTLPHATVTSASLVESGSFTDDTRPDEASRT